MSNLLWKYYLEDDVEKFRRLLANASHGAQYTSKGHGGGTVHGNNSYGSLVGSPGGFATSPRTVMKNRKVSGQMGNQSATKGGNPTIGRAELNSRDHAGLTVLHRCVSSTSENAISFAIALIEHPYIDLYVQDIESGWTALHRALYHGNITIARAIINRDARDPTVPVGNAIKSVIKVKDHEGNSPFDVYNATIARRTLQHRNQTDESDDESEDDDAESISPGLDSNRNTSHLSVDGDELFLFGSNKNLTLGFGDQDDRQHPEKIILKRPDHLLFRFYREHAESLQGTAKALHNLASSTTPKLVSELPSLIQNRPIIIQDVALSKLHSAILTTDPESNLYTCGFGPGGRLGTGDEVTRFTFVCIEQGGLAGKKVVSVALGQNHTLAVDYEGEIFSWGTNSFGQLGYTLPRPSLKDEEPMCSTPRQIFGPLKKESIIGVAASAIHSVAHTSTSLYTWGKNEGQLGLMDSDSGSLKAQLVPRKVAASLFKSSIVMVSAINRATVCLLANHTVCVFTNYGYNIVKFPLHESFSNYYLNSATLTTRYEAESNHISSITSGGDTIAAVSSRGDLFTITVSQKLENPTATSTTNPSKIKGSLSAPQRVWSLRKGNWDGIKSVGVAENGTVIVCTQAGAVWRRVKTAKIKDAYTGSGDFSRKDFKFQRIPGLTKVAAVRSNTFGVYAAIRKDSDVTKAQVLVDDKTLWKDIASLLSIRSLQATELQEQEKDTTPRFWVPALPKEHFDPLKRAVLMSPDIEGDVGRHLFGLNIDEEGYDVEICSTTSEIGLPVHGFMLAARSPVLRHALSDFQLTGTYAPSDVFIIERDPGSNLTKIVFSGLDFLTILNLVIYCYTDTVVDVWHFTRHSPPLAFRYRQVRTELMKAAALLKMVQLEAAARLMSEPEQQMDVDMALAVQDQDFFENGDAIIELEEGAELVAHSALLCQRCPFFQGLFNGRAGGRWLAGRREEDSTVRVDLKHIYAETFQLVLRYIYSDCGTELFDDVVSEDIDEFCELVLDVLAVANELMLDRLSQICQQVIGRFVNIRNICNLVNEVAPCAVTEFKDAGLEYLCLQLESMLENHLLDDLEEDLLLELDEVVRANQLNCLPFVKSGRAELLLHERHPSLAQDIDEERQRRIRDMAFRSQMKDEDYRLSSSFRARGSVDDILSGSPSNEKARRKSKATRNAPFSPSIRPKDSMADLMFDMDDDDTLSPGSPIVSPLQRALDFRTSPGMGATDSKDAWGKSNVDNSSNKSPILAVPTDLVLGEKAQSPKSSSKTWSSPVLPSTKLDMREIMAQATTSRTSNLSMSISAQKTQAEAAKKAAAPKLSQKERKKQQALQQSVQPRITIDTIPSDGKTSSPWQVATGTKTSLKEVLGSGSKGVPSVPDQLAPSPVPSKTLPHRRAPSPDTRFSGQRKVLSNTGSAQTSQKSSPGPSRTTSQPHSPKPIPLIPHSKSYTTTAKAEPSLQLSMADIIGQQQREQEVIKEAVAKRSLQEIQEEQAFQEWWDQESKRAQEEEAARARAIANVGKASGNARGKGGARGRGGRGRGEGRGRGKGKSQEKGATGN